MTDEMIRQSLIEKDEVVFQNIVNQYSKLLWAISYSILGKQTNPSEVEEIVSDVFFRLWKQPEKYDSSKSALKSYLVLMCKSMTLNSRRKIKRSIEVDDNFILESYPDNLQDGGKYWQFFYQAVETLNEPTKTICVERFFFEIKPSVISERCGLPLVEVNNRLYKGKQKIRKVMSQLILEEGE